MPQRPTPATKVNRPQANRPQAPRGRAAAPAQRSSWRRATLLLVLLICLTGIVPVALAGVVLGAWRITPSAPFFAPAHQSSSLTAPALAAPDRVPLAMTLAMPSGLRLR